jgi:signal transduction histidine kinase
MPTAMRSTAVQTSTTGVEHARRLEPSLHVSTRVGTPPRVSVSLRAVDSRSTGERASLAEGAVLEERARIARDLHDSVLQTFYAITLTASRARKLLDQSEDHELRHMLDDVVQLANTGGSELRALVTNIRFERLTSGGLTAALANLAADVRARHGLDIRMSLADEPELPATTKEALVLITREALHNVVRHAGAHCVDVVLDVPGREIVLLIADDGRGFDAMALHPAHFGLQSMRERATAVGGTLEVVSAASGTQVRVCISTTRNLHDDPRFAGR